MKIDGKGYVGADIESGYLTMRSRVNCVSYQCVGKSELSFDHHKNDLIGLCGS